MQDLEQKEKEIDEQVNNVDNKLRKTGKLQLQIPMNQTEMLGFKEVINQMKKHSGRYQQTKPCYTGKKTRLSRNGQIKDNNLFRYTKEKLVSMTKTHDMFKRPNPRILKKEEKVEVKSKGISSFFNESTVGIFSVL